jgi:hypothetical protein
MDVLDQSRPLSLKALRRLARRYYKQLLAGGALAVAATFGILVSMPAFADDGETKTPLAACDFTTLPLTSACAAMVTAPLTGTAGDYLVTLPGGGTLTIAVDATGMVTGATVSGLATGFTASVPTIDKEDNKVSVTVTSPTGAVVDVHASVKPPTTAGSPATVTAKAKPGETEDAEEATETAESSSALSEHKGAGGGEHHPTGGGGGGGD